MEKNCKVCGKLIENIRPSVYERKKYCSKECAKKGWAGVRRSPATEFKKGHGAGKHAPNYVDGPIVSKGYVLVRRPDHPRAHPTNKRVPEHIVVWEKANKRPVPSGWVVHHINGIKHDNRPENLVAMSRKGHHPALDPEYIKKRLREVEAERDEWKRKYEELLP